MSKSIWKNLKYKNVAVLLAIILLIILIICAACSNGSADIDPNAKKVQTVTENKVAQKESESDLFKESKSVTLQNDEALSQGNLVLVNGEHAFNKDVSEEVVSLMGYNTDSDGNQIFALTDSYVTATESAALQLQSMVSDFYKKSQNSTLFISSGFVASDSQEGEPFAAGSNDVGTGLSLSLGTWSDGSMGTFDGTGDFSWITENMAKYGFVVRYPEGKNDITSAQANPALIRYVGLPHAEVMSANSFCLEEYLEYVKSYTYDSPLEYNASNGVKYAIYYTEMKKGNATEVTVPIKDNGEEYTYAVSGNNIDGYIVTVAVEKTAAQTTSAPAENQDGNDFNNSDAAAAQDSSAAQTNTSASVFDSKETVDPKVTTSTVTPFIPAAD